MGQEPSNHVRTHPPAEVFVVLRHLHVRWTSDTGAPTAWLRGDVDADAAHELRAIGTVADEVRIVVVDVSDVDFVDLSGLDLLEELAARDNVQLTGSSPAMTRVLERVDGVITAWPALHGSLAPG
jgi:ABC-type transporter Mla MlaB component